MPDADTKNSTVSFFDAVKAANAAVVRFIYSDGFFPVCVGLSFFSWFFSSQFPGRAIVPFAVGAVLFALISAYILFFGENLKPLIALMSVLFYMLYLPSGSSTADTGTYMGALAKYAPFAVLLAPVAAGLVYFFVKHRRSFKKTKLFWPVIIFAVTMPLSGLLSGYYLKTWNITMYLWMALLYLFMTILMFSGTDGKFTLEYFSKCVLAAGAVVFLEMVVYYIRVPGFTNALFTKSISLGWGLSNNMGILFAMCVPAALYLSLKNRKYDILYALAAFVFFVSVFFTLSRGSILFSVIAAPFLVVFYILQSPAGKRKRRGLTLACCLLAAAAACLAFPGTPSAIAANLANVGLNDDGRFDIWRKALELFKSNPVFGVGYGYDTLDPAAPFAVQNVPFYIVSDTFLQFMASAGIVGLAASVFFFVRRYILFYDRWKPYHIFFLIMMLIYDGYSLLDGCCFLPYIAALSCFLFIALEQESDSPKRKLIQRKKWEF